MLTNFSISLVGVGNEKPASKSPDTLRKLSRKVKDGSGRLKLREGGKQKKKTSNP